MSDVIKALIFRRISLIVVIDLSERRTHKINVRRRKWTITTAKSMASIQPRRGPQDKGPLSLKDAESDIPLGFLCPAICVQRQPTFHINYVSLQNRIFHASRMTVHFYCVSLYSLENRDSNTSSSNLSNKTLGWK